MKSKPALPPKRPPTASGARRWTSEYERIHLMMAARLRAKRIAASRG